MRGLVGIAEDATVALVPEIASEGTVCDVRIPVANNIAYFVANELPYVCAHIPASQSVQVPIRLNRGQFAVMIVIIVIDSAHKILGNS